MEISELTNDELRARFLYANEAFRKYMRETPVPLWDEQFNILRNDVSILLDELTERRKPQRPLV